MFRFENLGQDADSPTGMVGRLGFQNKSGFTISFETYKKVVCKYFYLVSKMRKLRLNRLKQFEALAPIIEARNRKRKK